MSKRLQVLLPESELREIRRVARSRKLTVAEWVRQVLREAWRKEPRTDPDRKLEVVREAANHQFPSGDIDRMLDEIDQGYRSGDE